MRQLTSLLGSGLLFAAAVMAVEAGPYSFRAAPVLASAVELLALATLVLALTGNSEWSPVTGILLLLVMTMPLVGLTLGRSFPPSLAVGDLRCWVPLYAGLALLAIPGRSLGEASPAKGRPARAGSRYRILFGLYQSCVMLSAVLLGCRMSFSGESERGPLARKTSQTDVTVVWVRGQLLSAGPSRPPLLNAFRSGPATVHGASAVSNRIELDPNSHHALRGMDQGMVPVRQSSGQLQLQNQGGRRGR